MSLLAAQAFSTCICIDKYKIAKPTPWRSGRLAVTVFLLNLNLLVLIVVEVPDISVYSFYVYVSSFSCFLLLFFERLQYVFVVVRPVVALSHDGFERLLCALGRILIFLEKPLH